MEKEIFLIHKLNWFYSLEMNQVDLYLAQSKNVDDYYVKKLFERTAEIEQGHVDHIAQMIKVLGREPSHLGEVIGPITGKVAGTITGKTGLMNMLRIDIALESKAMADYKNAIAEYASDRNLYDLLWSNLIDEDLHTAWFERKLQELKDATE